MLKSLRFSFFLVLLGMTACFGSSPVDQAMKEGKPLVRVGDEKIHQGYVDLLERVNPALKAQMDNPMGKKRLLDNLIEQEMLYQESLNRGIEKLPSVKDKIDLYRRVVVAQSLIDEETNKKAKAYYDANKDKEFERVKVTQIFFSSMPKPVAPQPGKPMTPPSEEEKKKASEEAENQAKAAYEKLKSGESWDKVLESVSTDKTASARNTDLGYLSRGDKRLERLDYQKLVDAAFSLPKDSYSEPIQAKDGWHIIKVTEDKKLQPFSEVENSIRFKLRGEVKTQLMADLKNKMKVQYLDVSLAESQPANPPPINIQPPENKPVVMPESKPVESQPAK